LLLLLVLFCANSLAAEDYGVVSVQVEPTMSGGSRVGAYAERAFVLVNRSADPRDVRLSILMSGRRNNYAVRSVKLGARATQRVVLTWPILDRDSLSLLVTVDGRSYPARRLPDDRWDEYGGRAILISPDLDDIALQKTLTPGSEVYFRRASTTTRDWSTSWLAYDRFAGVVVTQSEWAEAPTAVQAAILRWVRCGGLLTIVPRAGGGSEDAEVRIGTTYLGFGRILDSNSDISRFSPSLITSFQRDWFRVHMGGPRQEAVRSSAASLLGDRRVPTRLLLWFLIAFAVAVGPISLWQLARRNRRIWIFWTVPAAGLVASVFLVGVTLASEGIHTVSRIRGLTYLDEVAGEATTLASAGFYCTFPPDGTLRFDGETEVSPSMSVNGVTVDLTDGQRFAGLIGSRVPSFIALRRSEPRRERVLFRSGLDGVTAVNGLGAPIAHLRVMMPDGVVWYGGDLPPGGRQLLRRSDGQVPGTVDALSKVLAEGSSWEELPEGLPAFAYRVLRPGTYVATLSSNPFVELPLGRGREATTSGVVIGQMRGEGGDAR
jgi:hypothetical protein